MTLPTELRLRILELLLGDRIGAWRWKSRKAAARSVWREGEASKSKYWDPYTLGVKSTCHQMRSDYLSVHKDFVVFELFVEGRWCKARSEIIETSGLHIYVEMYEAADEVKAEAEAWVEHDKAWDAGRCTYGVVHFPRHGDGYYICSWYCYLDRHGTVRGLQWLQD